MAVRSLSVAEVRYDQQLSDSRTVTVHSEPAGHGYQKRHSVAFGKTVTLPEPVGIELDTRQLLTWVPAAED